MNDSDARHRITTCDSGRVTANPEITPKMKFYSDCRPPRQNPQPVSAVGAVFPKHQGCNVVEPLSTTPTRSDGVEADRSGCLSVGFLIRASFRPVASSPAVSRPARRRLRLPADW